MTISRPWMVSLRMILILVFLSQVSACRKAEEVSARGFESRSVLQLHPSPITGEIDWNRSLSLLQSEDVLEKVSARIGCELSEVEGAIRFEADVKEKQLSLIARHEKEELAQEMVKAYAEVFMAARKQVEIDHVQAQLDVLNRELAEQSELVEEQHEKLQGLIEKYEIPSSKKAADGTREEDRLTYEKARRALAEDGSDLESGILFQKDDEE